MSIREDVKSIQDKKVARDLCDSLKGFIREELGESLEQSFAIIRVTEALDLIERAIRKDLIKRGDK